MGVAEPGDTAVKANGVVTGNGKPGDGERSFPTRGPRGNRQVLTGTQQGWGGGGTPQILPRGRAAQGRGRGAPKGSRVCEKRGGSVGGRGADGRGDRQTQTATRGQTGVYLLHFLGASLQRKSPTKQNNWDNNYNSLKTLSTAFFIFYIFTNFFKQIQNNLKGENYT